MAIYKKVGLHIPGSKEAAELRGILMDLEWVEQACSRIVESWQQHQQEYEPVPYDSLLLEALSVAAIIRYFRCFSSGVRPTVASEVVKLLPESLRQVNQYFKDLRDKHVAHSVNLLEANVVTVSIREADLEETRIDGLGFMQQRVAYLTSREAESLGDLAKVVRTKLEVILEQKMSNLRDAVQKIAVSDLAERDLISVRAHKMGDERRRR